MEQNIDNKIDLKDRLTAFYNSYKMSIYVFISTLIIISISITFIKINNEKKNTLTAEKYIQASLYLTSGKKEESQKIFEEIIYNKSKFYSILAFNKILENNLISDKQKILDYFKIMEEITKNEEQLNLIIFKKALYLIKISNTQEGNMLLKNLIDKNSKLKPLAEEILAK